MTFSSPPDVQRFIIVFSDKYMAILSLVCRRRCRRHFLGTKYYMAPLCAEAYGHLGAHGS